MKNNAKGKHSRHRVFNKETTFWAFFSQIIDADGGCAEVVKKLKTYLDFKGHQSLSASTGSYCKARKKLKETALVEILEHTAESFLVNDDDQPPAKRRVVVVDGTGLSMPDTLETKPNGLKFPLRKRDAGSRPCECSAVLTSRLARF